MMESWLSWHGYQRFHPGMSPEEFYERMEPVEGLKVELLGGRLIMTGGPSFRPWTPPACRHSDVRFPPASRTAGAEDEVMATATTIYEIKAIEPDVLQELRRRDDAGAEPRLLVDEEGGSPLRCCLRRVQPGERVALVSYAPLRRWAKRTGAEPGPYNEVGPVFIHPEPCAGPGHRGYPEDLHGDRKVFRAYGKDGQILGGRLVEPGDSGVAAAAEAALSDLFADPGVALVHVRAVEFGCFTFAVHRH
jgi:Protein of unknown function (DUF1203)